MLHMCVVWGCDVYVHCLFLCGVIVFVWFLGSMLTAFIIAGLGVSFLAVGFSDSAEVMLSLMALTVVDAAVLVWECLVLVLFFFWFLAEFSGVVFGLLMRVGSVSLKFYVMKLVCFGAQFFSVGCVL